MALSGDCKLRLHEWNFSAAATAMDLASETATEDEAGLIRALASEFGDSGWFEIGAMAPIVSAAVDGVVCGLLKGPGCPPRVARDLRAGKQ